MLLGGLYTTRASLELVALAANVERSVAEEQLEELERSGLLRLMVDAKRRDYCALHDLTYSYANALYERGSNKPDIVTAVRQYVQAHVDDYDALDFELVNILGAARVAYRNGNSEVLIDIMKLLAVDGQYLEARGPAAISLELLEAAINSAKRADNKEIAHYLLAKLGNMHLNYLTQSDQALEAYTKSLELAREINNRPREAILLSIIASTRFVQGQDDASDYYADAYQVAQESSDPNTIALILNHRCYYEGQKSPPDYETSRYYADEAVKIAREYHLDTRLYVSLINRANCERELGQLEQALETDVEAQQIAREKGNYLWMAQTTHSIGEDFHALGLRDRAGSALNDALDLYVQIGHRLKIDQLRVFMKQRGYEIRSTNLERGQNAQD